MQYGSGLARTGAMTLVIGGVSFTPLWQIAIAVGLVVIGGLTLNGIHRLRRNRQSS
jgi:hypothetical protein